MVQLADYLRNTSELLRDSGNQFTTTAALGRYINLARTEIAKRSACLEALITGQAPFGTSSQAGYAIPGATIPGMLPGSFPNNTNEPGAASTTSNGFTTIPGVELYTYSYANPFLQKQYEGYNKVIYVSDVAVSWGGSLPTLDWMPWGDLQAICRAYNIGMTSYPSVWSQKGVGDRGQVWIFPVPGNIAPGTMEWSCICTPKPLYTNDDFDALPDMYHSSVPYYAARMAYLGQQRTAMAEIMMGLFMEQLELNGVAADWGHTESHYQSWP